MYSVYSYINLYKLYKNQHIISVQEHNSPSTTSGVVQSANIVSDIKSLNKIFKFLKILSIWYANCKDIAKYIYVRDNSKLEFSAYQLVIRFDNKKNITNPIISITSREPFILQNNDDVFVSKNNNHLNVINLNIVSGENVFLVKL